MIYKVIKDGTIQDERGLDMELTAGQRLHDDGIELKTLVQAQIDGILTPDDGIEAADVAFKPVTPEPIPTKTKPQTDSINKINE